MSESTRETRVIGTLSSADGAGVVRIEDRYATDVDDLWSALTEPERVARWYGRVDGDLRPDGVFRVYVVGAGLYEAGRVDVCERPVHLRVETGETDEHWRPGDALPALGESIEVTLRPDGDATVLVLEARGMPLEKIAFYGAGWQVHAENLATYLAGGEAWAEDQARWAALVPPYQEQAAVLS